MRRNKPIWLGAVIVLAFLTAYIGALVRTLNEKSRRSLQLTDEVAVAGRCLVSIQAIKADPATRQFTARLQFRFAGNIAQDAMTPRVNLRLLANNSPGHHVFKFPEGERMAPIEATFSLEGDTKEGDTNRFPFDRYETNIWLFMDTPRQTRQHQATEVPRIIPDDAMESVDVATVVENELRGNESVPLSISLSASTPGMKYSGEVIRSKEIGASRVHLYLKRPDNLINVSVIVMCLMMGLALSVLAMVIRMVTSREKFEVIPLSLSITLIFGLPALRNIQPSVPPVGVLGDYFSFIWAELFVAAAAIIAALTWVWRHEREPGSKSKD